MRSVLTQVYSGKEREQWIRFNITILLFSIIHICIGIGRVSRILVFLFYNLLTRLGLLCVNKRREQSVYSDFVIQNILCLWSRWRRQLLHKFIVCCVHFSFQFYYPRWISSPVTPRFRDSLWPFCCCWPVCTSQQPISAAAASVRIVGYFTASVINYETVCC